MKRQKAKEQAKVEAEVARTRAADIEANVQAREQRLRKKWAMEEAKVPCETAKSPANTAIPDGSCRKCVATATPKTKEEAAFEAARQARELIVEEVARRKEEAAKQKADTLKQEAVERQAMQEAVRQRARTERKATERQAVLQSTREAAVKDEAKQRKADQKEREDALRIRSAHKLEQKKVAAKQKVAADVAKHRQEARQWRHELQHRHNKGGVSADQSAGKVMNDFSLLYNDAEDTAWRREQLVHVFQAFDYDNSGASLLQDILLYLIAVMQD